MAMEISFRSYWKAVKRVKYTPDFLTQEYQNYHINLGKRLSKMKTQAHDSKKENSCQKITDCESGSRESVGRNRKAQGSRPKGQEEGPLGIIRLFQIDFEL